MAYILDLEVTEQISPEECLELAEQRIDVDDLDSIRENAWILRALANDRDFVLHAYHEQLKSYWGGDRANEYQPQSLAIASNRTFFIRTNIWLPINEGHITSDFQKRLYAYELAHDHNFHFLTVGYYGEGYQTDIYTYDIEEVDGYVGEDVDLKFQGRFQLNPGRVMLYRAGKDIHIQYAPSSPALSLNLMGRNPKLDSLPQYIFDIQSKKIVGGAGDLLSNRLYVLSMFRQFHDENSIDILQQFVERHPCLRTQAMALNILMSLQPQENERLLGTASARVRELASREIVAGNYARNYSNS